MGWADDTMELPDNGLIKNALTSFHPTNKDFVSRWIQFAAATELTQSYATEVVYPWNALRYWWGYPREIKEKQ